MDRYGLCLGVEAQLLDCQRLEWEALDELAEEAVGSGEVHSAMVLETQMW
jgi:hypothetical protein